MVDTCTEDCIEPMLSMHERNLLYSDPSPARGQGSGGIHNPARTQITLCNPIRTYILRAPEANPSTNSLLVKANNRIIGMEAMT